MAGVGKDRIHQINCNMSKLQWTTIIGVKGATWSHGNPNSPTLRK